MSYQTNGSGIQRWDADAVPLATITLTGTYTWNATGVLDVGTPGDDCAYSVTDVYTISETKTHTATRSTYNHDSLPATDTFYVYRENGFGVRSFMLDERDLASQLYFTKDFSASIHHTTTYARTGPNPGGTCPSLPANVDEMLPVTLTLQCAFVQTDDGTNAIIEFTPSSNGIFIDGGYPQPDTGTDIVTPRIITIYDLKFGGSINFGSTATLTAANPDSGYWTSWTSSTSFTLAAS